VAHRLNPDEHCQAMAGDKDHHWLCECKELQEMSNDLLHHPAPAVPKFKHGALLWARSTRQMHMHGRQPREKQSIQRAGECEPTRKS